MKVKHTVTLLALALLCGCGVETAGTAASGAAIKKQELEQGQKTLQQAQQRIEEATDLGEQRAREAGDK
jgi:outer membrane biogenesis lipoprotein LolB